MVPNRLFTGGVSTALEVSTFDESVSKASSSTTVTSTCLPTNASKSECVNVLPDTSIAEANAFAPTFIADYNARFAKAPSNAFDAHRPMLQSENLDDIFTWQETRRVSQSLSFNYQRRLFLLQETDETRTLAGQRVTVSELDDGTVQVRHAGKVLPMTQFGKVDANITQGAVVANKMLAGVLQQIKDKQAKKDSDKFDKLRTQREKRLHLQRTKAVA